MTQFMNDWPAGQYVTVAASQTTQALGSGAGAVGDYLESVYVVPATATPGAVTIFDGVTAIFSIPAGTTLASYSVPIRAYSKTGKWNITTGASVSVVAIGRFT